MRRRKARIEEAVQFFNKMKQEQCFFSDIWGATLNFARTLKDGYEVKLVNNGFHKLVRSS